MFVSRQGGKPGPRNGFGVTRDLVADLHAQGLTGAEIARRLRVNRSTVVYHLRCLQRPRDPRFARRFDWEEIRRAYEAGLSARECRKAFGCSRAAWADAVRRGAIEPRPRGDPDRESARGRQAGGARAPEAPPACRGPQGGALRDLRHRRVARQAAFDRRCITSTGMGTTIGSRTSSSSAPTATPRRTPTEGATDTGGTWRPRDFGRRNARRHARADPRRDETPRPRVVIPASRENPFVTLGTPWTSISVGASSR